MAGYNQIQEPSVPYNQYQNQDSREKDSDFDYLALEKLTDQQYSNQTSVSITDFFPVEALAHYIDNPVDFIEDVWGIELEDWQKDVCNGVAKDDDGFVAIAAGSGVGKTFLLSKLVYWFLTTRKGKVPCTAPTVHQLFDILWSELKKDYDNAPVLQKIFTWTQTKLFVKGHVATWFAVARTATVRKDGKVQEGLQGFHDDNLMYIVDEASGVEDSAMAAVDGALTAHNAKIIMTSNPTRITGRFYNAFNKSSRAQGGPWIAIRVDCRNSRYVGKKYVSMMALEHGEDSPIFKAKVSGEFPDREEDALISLSDFDAAIFFDPSIDQRTLVKGIEDIPAPANTDLPYYNSNLFSSKRDERALIGYLQRVGFRGLYSPTFNPRRSIPLHPADKQRLAREIKDALMEMQGSGEVKLSDLLKSKSNKEYPI